MDLTIYLIASFISFSGFMPTTAFTFPDIPVNYRNARKHKIPLEITIDDIDEKYSAEFIPVGLKDIDSQALNNLTSDCRTDFLRFVGALSSPLDNHWALQMADATGKVESGILDGNAVFEGRYPQCIRAEEEPADPSIERPIKGQYCLAWWYMWIPVVRSTYQRGLGMCVPQTCTDDDVMILLKQVYDPRVFDANTIYLHCERGNDLGNDPEAIISIVILSLFGFAVLLATLYHAFVYQRKTNSVIPQIPLTTKDTQDSGQNDIKLEKLTDMLSKNNETPNLSMNDGDLTEQSANGDILPKVELSNGGTTAENVKHNLKSRKTTNEFQTGREELEKESTEREDTVLQKAVLCFSLYTNVPKIVTSQQPAGSYGCINGIRFLAMCWVILGHTYYLGPVEPVPTTENLTKYLKRSSDPMFSKIITGDVYVDTFLILSAFLMTISFLKQLKRKNGRLGFSGIALHYFNRYWRLTPTYFIILMIYTNLFHYFAEGPFMRQFIPDADLCSEKWWRNLLYINNMFIDPDVPLECFGWAWYLAVDMQMFIIAPLFLYILYRHEIAGLTGLILGYCGGLTANFVLYHEYYYQAPNAEDPVDEYTDIYVKTWTRCPVYFMGMLLGYLFYKTNGNIKIPKIVVAIGWIIAIALYLIVSYLPSLQYCTGSTVCGPWTEDALIAWKSLFRTLWGLYVCWMILACATGYGGIVDTFLSWDFFVPLGRLTYLGYLIHPIVCWLFFFRSPVQVYYTDYFFVYLFFANLVIVNLLSLVMASVFSAPLTGIMAVFLPNARKNVR